MKKIVKDFLKELKNLIAGWLIMNDNKTFKLVLNAYNKYEEEEKYGVDYVFDITNTQDVKCCLDGGMSLEEVVEYYNAYNMGERYRYFRFGVNYPTATPIANRDKLARQMIDELDNILSCMFVYHDREGYKELYDEFIGLTFKDVFGV